MRHHRKEGNSERTTRGLAQVGEVDWMITSRKAKRKAQRKTLRLKHQEDSHRHRKLEDHPEDHRRAEHRYRAKRRQKHRAIVAHILPVMETALVSLVLLSIALRNLHTLMQFSK